MTKLSSLRLGSAGIVEKCGPPASWESPISSYRWDFLWKRRNHSKMLTWCKRRSVPFERIFCWAYCIRELRFATGSELERELQVDLTRAFGQTEQSRSWQLPRTWLYRGSSHFKTINSKRSLMAFNSWQDKCNRRWAWHPQGCVAFLPS